MSSPNNGSAAVPADWQNLGRQFRHFQLLFVAVKARIPAALADRPATVTEISERLGFPAPRLRRILRGLIWCGAVDTNEDGAYLLTDAGRALIDDGLGSFAAGIRFEGEFFFRSWDRLWDYLETGDTPFERAYEGATFWDRLGADEELATWFSAVLSARSAEYSERIAAHPAIADRSNAPVIVDIGGGEGRLLADILQAHPNAQGVLLDLPMLESAATRLVDEEGLADRFQFVSGDMFAAVPRGGNVYLLKWVLHDWNDEDAVVILRRCAEALRPGLEDSNGARLLVIERLMPPVVGSTNAGLVQADLNMLCQMGGAERTLAEYEALFANAGLSLLSNVRVDEFYGFFALECAPREPKFVLEELLSEATPDNLHDEANTGSAVGRELW